MRVGVMGNGSKVREGKVVDRFIRFLQSEGYEAAFFEKPEEIGGVTLGRLQQYALRVRSDVEIVVQFGRMDVTQPNCSYIGLMGYSE